MATGRKTGGRQKGVKNKKGTKAQQYWHDIVVGTPSKNAGMTPSQIREKKMTVKEYFVAAFEMIQEDPELNLLSFAKQYPTAFYSMAMKLIPQEISAQVTQDINITWNEELTFESSKPIEIGDKNYIDYKEAKSEE